MSWREALARRRKWLKCLIEGHVIDAVLEFRRKSMPPGVFFFCSRCDQQYDRMGKPIRRTA